MLYGIDNILWNIFHIQYEMWGVLCRILSVPQNIVTDLDNVMGISLDVV